MAYTLKIYIFKNLVFLYVHIPAPSQYTVYIHETARLTVKRAILQRGNTVCEALRKCTLFMNSFV